MLCTLIDGLAVQLSPVLSCARALSRRENMRVAIVAQHKHTKVLISLVRTALKYEPAIEKLGHENWQNHMQGMLVPWRSKGDCELRSNLSETPDLPVYGAPIPFGTCGVEGCRLFGTPPHQVSRVSRIQSSRMEEAQRRRYAIRAI